MADFATVSDIFSAAGPPTQGPEKALVVAAYLQASGSPEGFTGRSVNQELKNLGHVVSNVTNTLDSLMRRRPQLVVQVRKSSNAAQAHKLYRVTREGFATVARLVMLGRPGTEGEAAVDLPGPGA